MTTMFNNFVKNSTIPSIWKQAVVTPIFKKGKSSLVENYRPISLTCVACKVFESTISKSLIAFFAENNLLSTAQHGFLSGHSTCTNLIEWMNDWTINVNNKHYTRVAYIDFSRAFDSVCHSKLLYKLKALGINGLLLRTIKSFLHNRSQRVMINGTLSNSVALGSGVPQGSVLGPLLFLVYINDLSNIFPDSIVSKYFADDAKIYTEVTSGDDIDSLQFSLDDLSEWAAKWQLSLSIKKCLILDVSRPRNNDVFYNNTLHDSELPLLPSTKDLGVIVDANLNFHEHVAHVVAEARKRCFLIFRCFYSYNAKSLMLGYKSYILPIVSYCTPVWSPCTIQDIDLIESVQRSFTKKIPELSTLSYNERLTRLNLPSLELRRLRHDLLFCYKILHGYVNGLPEKFGIKLASRTSRGHSLKLEKQAVINDVRKYFFGVRIVNPWNALPENVINAPSIVSFKKNLFKIDLSKFLICYSQ